MTNRDQFEGPSHGKVVVSKAEVTPKSMRWSLQRSRLVLWLEQLFTSFWGVFTLVLFGATVVRIFGETGVSGGIVIAFLTLIGVFMLILSWAGWRRFQKPTYEQTVARLDKGVSGRPFGTLLAKQSIGAQDVESRELWSRHLELMAQKAAASIPPAPKVRLSARDPFALRLLAIVGFVVAFTFLANRSLTEIIAGTPEIGNGIIAEGPSFEGWAEPPLYTRKPSFYLEAEGGTSVLKLPQNTDVTLRFYGEPEAFTVLETISMETEATEIADGSVVVSVEQSGELEIRTADGLARSWSIQMIPDTAPQVSLTAPISRTLRGSMTIPFQASDDYGVARGEVQISLRLEDVDRRFGLARPPEPRSDLSIEIPMPLNGRTKDFEETVLEELAEHPWAGLPVTIEMFVEDDLGNTGAIQPERVPMPGKRFFDDLAGAVAEQRRDLLWNRENAGRVAKVLRTITHRPHENLSSSKAYLILRSAIRRIEYNQAPNLSDEVRDEVSDLLWKAALLIEDGDLSDAEQRLKRAQERLSEAIENGATKEEIAELMDDLRRATEDYIDKLAENAEKNPDRQQAQNGEPQEVTPDMLQQMMDEIQSLMEQGRMAEAQELLERLQQLMENMEVTQGDSNGQGQEQDGERGGELSETLREQQELSDDTFQEMQRQFNENRQNRQAERGEQPSNETQSGEPQSGDPENNQQGNEGEQGQSNSNSDAEGSNGQNQQSTDLAERQQALRDMLDRQQGAMSGDETEAGKAGREALERAQEGMGLAEDSLREGDISGALDNQADAMEALREGIQNLQEGNQQANGQSGQARPGPGEQRSSGRDPLGRPSSNDGAQHSEALNDLVQDELRKSREVLDEIRRRSGEQSRPTYELDYLKRLLERF